MNRTPKSMMQQARHRSICANENEEKKNNKKKQTTNAKYYYYYYLDVASSVRNF